MDMTPCAWWPKGATGTMMHEIDGIMVQDIYEGGVLVKRGPVAPLLFSAEASPNTLMLPSDAALGVSDG